MNEKFEKNKKIEIFLKKYLHFRKRWCILNESTAKSERQINKWPVGQGVKTSPSHGENTSSILVLAARNFRSDSEVFLLFEYIPAWVMPSLFVQKDAAKRLFSSTLRRLDSDLRQSES